MEWIVTDNIRRETWRRLLEYSNIDITIDEIAKRHGAITAKTAQNYKKQAEQVRVCVIQAKEYFDAGAASTIFTSPNHVYYGAVSLASMMMLILGNGDYSLDVLRRNHRNHHHGLKFKTDCTPRNVSNGLTLVEKTSAKILRRGHFANWYSTLPKQNLVHALVVRTGNTTVVNGVVTPGATSQNWEVVGGSTVPTMEAMIGLEKAMVDLLKFIPDLSNELHRYQIHEPRTRSSHTANYTNKKINHQWALHGAASAHALEVVLSQFGVRPDMIDRISFSGVENTHGAVVKIDVNEAELPFFRWPSSRETLNHDTVSYGGDVETHEIVDFYLIGYQLSMMSRYYPDLWIRCIESQCKAAKLIETAVDIFLKKFPIMVLSTLSSNGMTISTHRPPWAS